MKKIILITLAFIALVSNTFAWSYVQGTVKRVWINGWASKPDIITFEITPNSGYPATTPTKFGVREDATEANKNRVLSVLLSAQNSGQEVMVYFHDQSSSGPVMEVGNDSYQTWGIQFVSIITK